MAKKKNIFEIIAVLFIASIPLQPVVTMYGFYFISLLVILGGIVILSEKSKIPFSKFEKMQFFFLLLMIISLLIGEHTIERAKYVFGIIRYVLFIFMAMKVFLTLTPKDVENKGKFIIKKVLDIFSISTVLVSIYVLVTEPSTNGFYGRMGRYAFSGDYGGYIMYSYNLMISILWSIFEMFESSKNKKFYILMLLILGPCALLNGTRKTIFAIALFLLGYILLASKNILKKSLYILLCVFLLFFAYKQITTNEYLKLLIGNRINSFISSIIKDSGDNSTTERSLMRKEAFKYFKESPIYGNGISSFMYHFGEKYGVYLYSHNNYLEILSCLGIVGFAVYYGWYLKELIQFKNAENRKDRIWLFCFLFMLVMLVLDYGTVSFDKIHYILIFDLISIYNGCCVKKRGENNEIEHCKY